jgi:hypothetical protein|tara:strand:+ start:43 stop:564 length:522 start_codon:yes stop_codon:yes gene_type:complete
MKASPQPIEDLSLAGINPVEEGVANHTVTLVPSNYLNTIWPDVEGLLKGGADRTGGRWDLRSLFFALAGDKQQLWVTFDKDNEITNALTTEIIYYPNKISLAIQFAGGADGQVAAPRDALLVYDVVLNKLERYAKDVGCHCIEIWGRKGFSRKLKRAGYEESLVFYEKDITHD